MIAPSFLVLGNLTKLEVTQISPRGWAGLGKQWAVMGMAESRLWSSSEPTGSVSGRSHGLCLWGREFDQVAVAPVSSSVE